MQVSFGTMIALVLATADGRATGDKEKDKDNPGVYPLTEKVGGKSYAEWSAAWWQWGLAAPKDKNPIADETGKYAEAGQSGPVWFLAGNFGGKATRKCSVPADKAIFFPVVNQFAFEPDDKADEKALRAFAKRIVDTAGNLEVTVDGKPLKDVKQYRVESPLFILNGPENAADEAFPGIAGKHKVVSDGYWIMLKPLPPGKHVIRFKGEFTLSKFSLDVSYELTVVKAKSP
jgi:hypothetical protein